MLAEVAVDMTRVQGMAEVAAQCMGVVNLLQGALDRPLPVVPLVDIRQGVPLPRRAISPLPRVQGAAITLAAELVVGPVQLVELAGGLLLVTEGPLLVTEELLDSCRLFERPLICTQPSIV